MQKKTKQLLAALALLLVAAVPLGLRIVKTDSTETASSTVVSASEEQAESPASSASGASSAAASASVPESQPEEPGASSEEENSGAESEDAGVSSSEAVTSSNASSPAASSESAAHSAASSHAPASSSQAASSSHSTASSHVASSSSYAKEKTDARINAYVQQIRDLQKRSTKKLYQTASDAYSEYMEHPVQERNLALKISIVLGKTAQLTMLQSECDKEFKAIIKELRQYLRDNGYDQSIADAAEKEYKAEKDAMIKELTNLTYSQVTGRGEGAKWLQDHYAEMGQ